VERPELEIEGVGIEAFVAASTPAAYFFSIFLISLNPQ